MHVSRVNQLKTRDGILRCHFLTSGFLKTFIAATQPEVHLTGFVDDIFRSVKDMLDVLFYRNLGFPSKLHVSKV